MKSRHDKYHSCSFNCPETQRRRKGIFLGEKWQMIKEEKSFRKL